MAVQQEMIELVKVKMKDGKISFSEALVCVCRDRPEVANEYREEVLKSPTIFEAPPEKDEFTPSPRAAELTRLAKEKMERDGVKTFSEALLSVCRERPLLASEYRQEVIKSKV